MSSPFPVDDVRSSSSSSSHSRVWSWVTRSRWYLVAITVILLIYSINFINNFPTLELLTQTATTTPTTTTPTTTTPTDTVEVAGSDLSQSKWAFATLYPRSEPSSSNSNSNGEWRYRHLVCILMRALNETYPNIPKLIIVGKNHVTQQDQEFFTSIGLIVLEREIRQPAYGSSMKLYSGVYEDQFMKFYLWNELSYDYIIYLDADHYVFRPVNFMILLEQYQQLQKKQQQQQQQQQQQVPNSPIVIACPTTWSKLIPSPDSPNTIIPLTWNGGFFVISPNKAVYDHLWNNLTIPTHFSTHYPGALAFLDTTEMGTFLRDFPLWFSPDPSLMIPVCGEFSLCCPYVAPGEQDPPGCPEGCKADRAGGAILNKRTGIPHLVHGLKPKPGWLQTWSNLGYNGTCLMTDFYPHIQEQTQKYATCQVL